jgi:ankyrin repeat protein
MAEIETFKSYIDRDDTSGIVRILLQGANINCIDMFGYTPLHWSSLKGRVEILKLLIKMGASIDKKCLNYSFTPLHVAINENQNAIVNILINEGADIMARDKDGNTPLHYASMLGNESVVQKLLIKGANINAFDNQGVTPYYLANYYGHSRVVNILLNARS